VTDNKENEGAGALIDAEIVRISQISTSRQNFLANLNQEERTVSSVAGVLGKPKLNPKRVDYTCIKRETYRMYPLQ
jgi:hypothetical protein